MSLKNKAFLAAGGTGGHINAAIAIGEKLREQNFEVLYLTGVRPLDYKLFQGQHVLHLKVQGLRGRGIFAVFGSLVQNFLAFLSVLKLMVKERPSFVFGAGGYVCGPICLAAYLLRIPIYILEQNSVLGLTNRILCTIADKVFLNFRETRGLPRKFLGKAVLSGNPVRASIIARATGPSDRVSSTDPQGGQRLKVLVFGGSLGAKEINDLIRSYLQTNLHLPLWIKHQIGQEDSTAPVKVSSTLRYETYPYFNEIFHEYAWADLIICRSGASTLSELKLVGKPTLLIPFPKATDNHQLFNALSFKSEVDFPVWIDKSEELRSNNCKKLNDILEEYWENRSRYDISPSGSTQTRGAVWASDIILGEILGHVQKSQTQFES